MSMMNFYRSLKARNYVRISDNRTFEIATKYGEFLVTLEPTEIKTHRWWQFGRRKECIYDASESIDLLNNIVGETNWIMTLGDTAFRLNAKQQEIEGVK